MVWEQIFIRLRKFNKLIPESRSPNCPALESLAVEMSTAWGMQPAKTLFFRVSRDVESPFEADAKIPHRASQNEF